MNLTMDFAHRMWFSCWLSLNVCPIFQERVTFGMAKTNSPTSIPTSLISIPIKKKSSREKRWREQIWDYDVELGFEFVIAWKYKCHLKYYTYNDQSIQRLKTSCGEFNNDLVKYDNGTLLFIIIIGIYLNKREKRTNLHKSNDNHFSCCVIYLVYIFFVSQCVYVMHTDV